MSDHECLELPTWGNVAAKVPETEESSRAGNYFEKGGQTGRRRKQKRSAGQPTQKRGRKVVGGPGVVVKRLVATDVDQDTADAGVEPVAKIDALGFAQRVLVEGFAGEL